MGLEKVGDPGTEGEGTTGEGREAKESGLGGEKPETEEAREMGGGEEGEREREREVPRLELELVWWCVECGESTVIAGESIPASRVALSELD